LVGKLQKLNVEEFSMRSPTPHASPVNALLLSRQSKLYSALPALRRSFKLVDPLPLVPRKLFFASRAPHRSFPVHESTTLKKNIVLPIIAIVNRAISFTRLNTTVIVLKNHRAQLRTTPDPWQLILCFVRRLWEYQGFVSNLQVY